MTLVLFQPLPFAAGVCDSKVMVGADLSILMSETVLLAELPALSWQVAVWD